LLHDPTFMQSLTHLADIFEKVEREYIYASKKDYSFKALTRLKLSWRS